MDVDDGPVLVASFLKQGICQNREISSPVALDTERRILMARDRPRLTTLRYEPHKRTYVKVGHFKVRTIGQTLLAVLYILRTVTGTGQVKLDCQTNDLHVSSQMGRTFVVQVILLLALALPVGHGYCGQHSLDTELINAAKSANIGKIKQLLAAGASVDVKDRSGKTALCWACYLGHEEAVSLLLDEKADANLKERAGSTALIEASREGRADIVKLLLDKREVLKLDHKGSLVDVLAAAKGKGSELVKPLRAKKIEIDAADNRGNTALILAAAQGYPKVVSLLLSKGADARIRNSSGMTALDMAEKKGRLEVVDVLTSHKGGSRKAE